MKPPIENENDDEKDVRFSQSEKCWKLIIWFEGEICLDFKEKDARAKFTGTEIISYNLNRLNINVWSLISSQLNFN